MTDNSANAHREVDAVVVGAGFGGLYLLHRLRSLGLSVQVFEAGDDVGGTWYWNRYPGARCDAASLEYSYQFDDQLQHEWQWSEKYATQPEILRYIQHVADRYDLRRDIRFNTRVGGAHWDEAARRWRVSTDDGSTLNARFFVLAAGCLSATNLPKFEGLENYQGERYHTGRWPHGGVDFSGKRVGIIGTGSSAVQAVPLIAQEAAHLTVFQRTPNWCIPAHNGPIDPEHEARVMADYAGYRERCKTTTFGVGFFNADPRSACEVSEEEREATFERLWNQGGLEFLTAFADLVVNEQANLYAREFVARKIREKVKDPAVAKLLTPNTMIGCKRLCVDSGYYETFNRDNVTLVSVKENPIERFTDKGLVVDGTEYEFDAVIFATGFDAMTGPLLRMDITGRNGQPLQDAWAAGPVNYLGLMVRGFPNMFTITGPGSPSVLSNMVPAIEQHGDFVADMVRWLDEQGLASIEPTSEAQAHWVGHVNDVASHTLLLGCNSWYLGANVPGKPRVFLPYIGVPAYNARCDDIAASGYEGFETAA